MGIGIGWGAAGPGGGVPAPTMYGRVGINTGSWRYFDGQAKTPDVMVGSVNPVDTASYQTTLSSGHTSGGVWPLTALSFTSRTNRPGDIISGLSMQVFDPATSTLLKFPAFVVAGTGAMFSSGAFTVGSDRNVAGAVIVDNITSGIWGNTNNSALAANYIDTGSRDTGYPAGLVAGQTIGTGQLGTNRRMEAGTWTVLANGSGTVVFNITYYDGTFGGNVTCTFVNGVAATNTFTLTKEASVINLTFNSTGANPANPLRDVRVVEFNTPGFSQNYVSLYTANQSSPNYYLPHPRWVSQQSNYPINRLMDETECNASLVVNWADRALQGTKPGLYQVRGIPYEYMITYANQTNKGLWINVPHQSSDDFNTQLATLVATTLNANKKVYVEWSNEVWNGIFQQQKYSFVRGTCEFTPYAVNSITFAAGTATVSATAHGFSTGNTVQIDGAVDPNYNGAYTITVVDVNTFTYAPSSSPGSSPAVAGVMRPLTAALTSACVSISTMAWVVASNSSLVTITTSSNHGLSSGDVVQVSNASDAGFNGVWSVKGITSATVFTISFLASDGLAWTRPVPACSALTTNAAAVAGQTMRVLRLGSNSGGSSTPTRASPLCDNTGMGRRYQGRRSQQVHNLWKTVFAANGRASDLAYVVGVQAAQAGATTAQVMNQVVADWGGALPAGTDYCLSYAPYFGSIGGSDTTLLQGAQSPTAFTFAAGTVTVTLANHGFSTNDSIQILNVGPKGAGGDAYNGIWTITKVDNNTFTYTPVGTPTTTSGLTATLGAMGMQSIKNGTYFREVISEVLSAGTVTCTSYNHGLTNNEVVYLSNMAYPEYMVKVAITVVDANTFTFATTATTNPTVLSGSARFFIVRATAITQALSDSNTHLTGTVPGWCSGNQTAAATYGMRPVCYEAGPTLAPSSVNKNFIPLSDTLVQANRETAMGTQCETYFGTLQQYGVTLANWFSSGFTSGNSGSWGLLEFPTQDPTTSPKYQSIHKR